MTLMLVATLGGHLTDLRVLADRFSGVGSERVWVTNRHPQTETMAGSERVEFVPYVDERDVAGVLRNLPGAGKLLRRYSPEVVVSTGSALALAYLPLAAARGHRSVYVECSARVKAPSVTGRLLARTPGVQTWWGYPGVLLDRFPFHGGVFDGYTAGRREGWDGTIRRAVVTVGTTRRGFGRLIGRVAGLLPASTEVLWQTGQTDVTQLPIVGHELIPHEHLERAMRRADVVITHGGCGSVLMALQAGRLPVVVPRRLTHGEHVDDHQIQIAEWIHRAGLGVHVEADHLSVHHLHLAASAAVAQVEPPPIPIGELVA